MPDRVPFWFTWQTPSPVFKRMTLQEAFNQPTPLPIGLVHIAQVNVADDPNHLGQKMLSDLDRQALCGYELPEAARKGQRSHAFEEQHECQDCKRIYAAWLANTSGRSLR